jgi:hypothetical protein
MNPTISVTACLHAAIDVITRYRERTIMMPTPVVLEDDDLVIVTHDTLGPSEDSSTDREISLIGPLVVFPFVQELTAQFTNFLTDGCMRHVSNPDCSSERSMQRTSNCDIEDCCP